MLPPSLGDWGGPIIAALVAVIGVLWKLHLDADSEDRKQRDTALDGWREQTTANNRLAAAWDERNRRDADRHRRDDP